MELEKVMTPSHKAQAGGIWQESIRPLLTSTAGDGVVWRTGHLLYPRDLTLQSEPSGYFSSIHQSSSSPGKKELSFTPPPTPVCFFKLISPGFGLRERIRDTDPISTPSPGSPAPYLRAGPPREEGRKVLVSWPHPTPLGFPLRAQVTPHPRLR